MTSIYLQVAAGLGAAWTAGAVIGAERSFHGRAAGFRTHALVGLAAAAAVMVSLAPTFAPGVFPGGAARLDPTRLAQGVMTGIGFLGAGVIFKEGVNVQGLTTAASVWATAAIGLLCGVGAYVPAGFATLGVVATLLMLRWVEDRLPAQVYAWSVFRFRTPEAPDKAGLQAMLAARGVSMRELSYARSHDGAILEFSGNLMARRDRAFDDLAEHLRALPALAEFELSRISK
ncbi:MgtC/SapB family protein [Phenylobacterium sp.]|uniref:MgtC/SapB family protein n=1 Tax=Phenylobacterium sp. TaxID=1871053 RepID=UPI002DF363D2|nr:MgtC/SapB family protein [Phenylobacterium sp.]